MNYVNAKKVLPEELLAAIQQHIQGETLYIPKQRGERLRWGTASGSRHTLDERNREIRRQFTEGERIGDLAAAYHLSADTIKKIVYTSK
ncbi:MULTISPECIES: CD3324 family protein [Sporosarcina]|uniref:CD3324 family protein n=1 Tax=Sporosarcina TaxID=1569 RepID=UPI00058BC0B9|nr:MULTISPECIES: CD3324 family protein [Sporosarcina]WJY27583.1 CD3324 family protein [Sporosarcina sp. 0.2-SM1T-5]